MRASVTVASLPHRRFPINGRILLSVRLFQMSPRHVCICLGREAETNKQAQTKSYQKMTSAATAAGCGTARRGARERGRLREREREENN